MSALKLIKERLEQNIHLNIDFNEVLTAAYMERQKMAVRETTPALLERWTECLHGLFLQFHSDDEKGLGPVVAGLSLGSPAMMHFRLHSRYLNVEEDERRENAISFILRHVRAHVF
jgi:hypothetical protein